MAAIRLLVARLRRDRLPMLLLALLVAVSAGMAAAGPRLFTRAADDGLRHEVATASVVERNLQLGRITRIDSAPGQALAPVDAVADEVRAALPPTVRSILSGDSVTASSISYSVVDRPPTRPGFVTLAFQDRLDDEIRLLDGRMPTGETRIVPAPDLPPAAIPIPEDREAIVFEAALSTRTAEELGAAIGDLIHLVPDRDDTLVGAAWQPEAVAVEVVGIYEVVEPGADFWIGFRGLHEPTLIPIGINVVEIHAHALMAPDAYPVMLRLSYPMRYAFRHTVEADALDAGMVAALATELRRMEASYPSFATQPDPNRTTMQWALANLLDAFAAERRSSEAVLTTAVLGPAAVAVTAAAVIALLAVRRRRPAVALLRSRGGSAPQLLTSHLFEGLLFTAGPAAVGAVVAVAIVDARATPLSWVAAAGVAIAATVVLVVAVAPSALRSLRDPAREEPAPIGASPRRLAFEALVIGLAIGGIFLLRQRGLAGGSAAGQLEGVDPFLAAVPALVGLAVGIVTVRAAPYPIHAAGWLAASGRGLVASLGLRRAERQSGAGQLPLIVVLLTVAIGAFSSTMLATIDRGQVDESWRAVGADYRIVAVTAIPRTLEESSISGVEAVAGAHETEATVGATGGSRATLIAIDAAAYETVTAGTPIETTFPDAFTVRDPDADPEVRPGSTEAPIPAIVSRGLAATSTTSLRVGDTFELRFAARFATFRVAELRDAMPSRAPGEPFMVVPRDLLLESLRDRPLPTTSLFIRAPDSASQAVSDAVAATDGAARYESRTERLATLRDRPLISAIGTGFLAALVVSIGYAALAILISMLLAGAARARETAQLRTMGVGRGQIVGMTLLENGPPVVVAMAAGLGLGLLVAWVVLPGLGLSAFTGATADPDLTIDPGVVGLLAGVLLAVVAVGVLLGAWAQRRIDPATAVREGAE